MNFLGLVGVVALVGFGAPGLAAAHDLRARRKRAGRETPSVESMRLMSSVSRPAQPSGCRPLPAEDVAW